MSAHAAVIIPHHKDVRRLSRCLDALIKQPDAERAEIVVVDSGGPEIPSAMKQNFSSVRFVDETTPGAGPARNRGVAESNAPLLFFIDCDCIPAEDWLSSSFHAIRGKDSNHIIGGKIDLFDETNGPRTGAQAFETVFGFRQETYIKRHGFLVTANLLTSRKLFEKVGGFRADVSEDKEWCKRARGQGAKITYNPSISVYHPTRVDWEQLKRKWRRLLVEDYADVGTPINHAIWIIRAGLMPVSIMVHMPSILRSPKLNGSRERWAAIRTLAKLRFWRMLNMLFLASRA